jgi:hypothetical protein
MALLIPLLEHLVVHDALLEKYRLWKRHGVTAAFLGSIPILARQAALNGV